jgi:hypothetical protein
MSGFKIKIVTAEGPQTSSIPKSHLLIGSAQHCDIQLAAGDVAGEHLRVWSDGDHLWGQDLGSPHGTMLNGQSLLPMRPVMFHEVDLFKIGSSDVTLAFQTFGGGPVWEPAQDLVKEPSVSIPPEILEKIEKLQAENFRLERELEDLNEEQTQKTSVIDAEEEEEISQVKHNALTEIQAMKEAESRRFEVWKSEAVEELEKLVDQVFKKSDPKMSREDLCQDVTHALRASLLGETMPAPRRRHQASDGWQRHLLAFILITVMAGIAFLYVKRSSRRQPASVVFVPAPSKQAPSGNFSRPRPAKNSNP